MCAHVRMPRCRRHTCGIFLEMRPGTRGPPRRGQDPDLSNANSVSPHCPRPLRAHCTRASGSRTPPSSPQAGSAESFFCFQKELSILRSPLLSLGILLIRKIHGIPHLLTEAVRWSGDERTPVCHSGQVHRVGRRLPTSTRVGGTGRAGAASAGPARPRDTGLGWWGAASEAAWAWLPLSVVGVHTSSGRSR